jgi:hypothetical protein
VCVGVSTLYELKSSPRGLENEKRQGDGGACYFSTHTSRRHQGQNSRHVALSFHGELCDNRLCRFDGDLPIHNSLGAKQRNQRSLSVLGPKQIVSTIVLVGWCKNK